MKAIIGLEDWSSMQRRALDIAARFDAGEPVTESDYYLNFSSLAELLRALPPSRLALLDTLKALGAVSIPTLAQRVGSSENAVRTDLAPLIELGLVENDDEAQVLVPWDAIQVRFTLDGSRAA
jgi:predicted transcriptional regulator